MYGYNAGQPMAIPIYTVLPYCVIQAYYTGLLYMHICICTLLCIDEIHKVVVQGNKLLKTKVPPLRSSLATYLANEETEHILFKPIRVS